MKKLLSALLAAILLACMVSAGEVRADGAEAALTLMVYMTGSDLESKGSAATGDILEMLRSGVDTSRVNVVLMVGGSTKWSTGFPTDKLSIYRLTENRPELMEETELASMGEPETLRHLLDWGYEHCPAERYALILWDHGGGPMEGVCYDELYGGDTLSLPELREALEGSALAEAGEKLEWIGFDACLMGAVETAHVVAPHARYMIASQETEPGSGWDYGFLQGIEDDADGAATGRRIIDGYFAAAEGSESALTLSCVELGKIGAVEGAMDGLFGELDREIDVESYSALSNGRRDAKGFGRGTTGSDYDLVDLSDLGAQYAGIAPEEAAALSEAIAGAVVYARSNVEGSAGLSVYHPYYNKSYYTTEWGAAYPKLGLSAGYERYIEDYAGLWLGESLADWRGLEARAEVPAADGQELTMALTQEQVEHFASAEVYILDEVGTDGAYYEIYHMDAGAPEDGMLHARYEYEALYVLDADGNPLSDALPYIAVDDSYLVRAVLSEVDANDDFYEWAQDDLTTVYLQCKRDPGSDALRIVGVIEIPGTGALANLSEEDVLLMGKQTVTLDSNDWPWILFLRLPRLAVSAEDGSAAAFPDWPFYSDARQDTLLADYSSISNRAPWSLQFCKSQYGDSNLYAQYVVTDTQGERFASDLIPVENPNLVSRLDEEFVLLDEDDLRVALTGVEVIDSRNDPCMRFTMHVENRTGERVWLKMEWFALDRTAIGTVLRSDCMVEDSSENVSFSIPASELPPLAHARAESVSFDLVVRRGNDSSNEQRIPVRIDREIELGGLALPLPETGAPIAETANGAVRYQLLTLEERQDGKLSALLHVENGGAENLKLSLDYADCFVNDSYVEGGVQGERFIVPPGCDAYTQVVFDCETEDPIFGEPFVRVNAFDYWGIEAVERLELGFYVGEEIDFVLDEAFALRDRHEAPPEAELFAEDGLSVGLRGAELVDGALRLHVAIRNTSESELQLSIVDVCLDSQPCEATLWAELEYGGTSMADIDPTSAQRGIVEIPLDGGAVPERLELSFRFTDAQGDWQQTAPISIEPPLGDVREMAVTPGEVLPNAAIDPVALFDAEVAAPADAARSATSFSVQLTPEQVANFDYGVLAVGKRVDGGYRICYVLRGIEPDANGVLRADYRGMLFYAAGANVPVMAYESVRGSKVGCAELSGLTLISDTRGVESLSLDNVVVRMDDGGPWVEAVEVEREVHEIERYSQLETIVVDWIPVYNDDGSMQFLSEWTVSDAYKLEYTELEGGRARLEMRPAEEYAPGELCVLFSVRNADGSGYTLEPIPYASNG